MNIYNTLFGENKNASVFLDILDLNKEVFGRYRDCHLNEDGTEIHVLTRCGDINRELYRNVFLQMTNNPDYRGNFDDPTDPTYCWFVFKVPVLYLPQTRPLATGKRPLYVGEKFNIEMDLLNKNDPGAIERANKLAKKMEKKIEAKKNGGIIFMGDDDWRMTEKEE